jgi:hypothetical protein
MKIFPMGILYSKGGVYMVKGISRQVILVQPREPKLFEQAIFILRSDLPAEGISDEVLLKEAEFAAGHRSDRLMGHGPLWACGGALCTGIIWLLTALL